MKKRTKVIAFRADLETQFMLGVLKYKNKIHAGQMSLGSALRTAENRTGYNGK